jgi:hypothetical protein
MFDRAADEDANSNGSASEPLPRRAESALRRLAAWTLIGIGLGLVGALVILRQMHYDPTPTLTPELYEQAHARWKMSAPANYDIEVRVTGPQAAVYRVEVRDGQAQAAWRNDQPLKSHRTFGTWSVPGMFSTMSRDIEALERAAVKRSASPLILRAEFDPQYSYPRRYRRIDNGSRKGGDAIAVTWDVTRFQVITGER